MRIISGLLTLALLFVSMILQANQLERQSLFKIERSKNANIIQYDAQIGTDSRLYEKEPVIGYWVRLAEHGQVQELSWVQRNLAFGFDADFHPESDSVTLKMAADIGQPILVRLHEGKYRGIVEINGKPSQLEKIFIQSHGKGISVTVDYIDIHGNDLGTGQETFMRVAP
jgi:hypothetical protein